MGEFQAMHKYFVVFLALFVFHGSLLTHGRQIKPLNQHPLLNTDSVRQKDNIPTPSAEKKINSPVIPNYDVDSFEDPGAVGAFRPTTPGSSPGVGHRKFAGENDDVKAVVVVHSPDVKVSVAEGFKDDIKSTGPGHSPGVGHAYPNRKGQLN